MASGIRLANPDDPELASALEEMRDQLLLAFVRRLGGKVKIPVAEIDQTGRYILDMAVEQGASPAFTFTLRKKQ